MKKIIFLLSILLLTVSLFARGAQEASGIQIVDAYGREIYFQDVPQRVSFGGRAAMMVLNALYLFDDMDSHVVGVGVTDQGLGDFFDVLSHDADNTERLGRQPSVETLAGLETDLVILKDSARQGLGELLETVGLPVVYLDLETHAAFKQDIRNLGKIFRQEERASEIIEYYESKLALLKPLSFNNRMLVLQATGSGEDLAFSVSPREWVQAEQVLLSGSTPVWADAALNPGWNIVSFEQIAAWDAEYIAIISYRSPADEIVSGLYESLLWKELSAVQNNRLLAFPSDYYSWGQPDTRWILGALWLASVQDEAKELSFDFKAEFYEFFRTLYFFDDESIETIVNTKLQGLQF